MTTAAKHSRPAPRPATNAKRPSRARTARTDATRTDATRTDVTRTDVTRTDVTRTDATKADRPKVGDKREAIIHAALELFVERGFYGTAVPEIAERASVGAGTIYRYFESKEALVNAIYRERKLAFSAAVLENFPVMSPTREQFRQMWTRMSRFAILNPKSFVFLELHHHAPYLDAESRAVEQRMTDVIQRVVEAAQARGELKTGDPRLLMGIVIGGFVGVIRSCLEAGHPVSQADWVLAEQCCWEAIRS